MGIDIRSAFEVEPEPLDFVFSGLLAESVGCLCAAGSSGKSFFAIEAAMSVASKKADEALLQLRPARHGKVLILSIEDNEVILRRRLFDIGKLLSADARDEVIAGIQIEALVGKNMNLMDSKWQEAVIAAASGVRLIIVDTLSRCHRLNECDNGDMSTLIAVFEMIARRTGAAVLFLHHISKSMAVAGRADEQQSTRGASALVDNVRWQGFMTTMSAEIAESLGIAVEDRKRYVLFGASKQNYGQNSSNIWLKRGEGGVLRPVTLHVKAKVKVRKGSF